MKNIWLALLAVSCAGVLPCPAAMATVVPTPVSLRIRATTLASTCPAFQVTLLHGGTLTTVVNTAAVHVRAGSVLTLIVVCGERYGVGHFTVMATSEMTFESHRKGPSSYDQQQGSLPDFRVRHVR